ERCDALPARQPSRGLRGSSRASLRQWIHRPNLKFDLRIAPRTILQEIEVFNHKDNWTKVVVAPGIPAIRHDKSGSNWRSHRDIPMRNGAGFRKGTQLR